MSDNDKSLKDNDWLNFWRELVAATSHTADMPERLQNRYKEHARKQSERFDPLLDFILKEVDSQTTAIDIGAGNGRWAVPLARICKSVTAIEPSPGMRAMLQEKVEAAGLHNVQVIPASWDEAVTVPHDIVVCAHAMYSAADLSAFVRKIEQYAKKACYLALRLPPSDGIIGRLSLAIHGTVHDSPNAVVAYNALFSLDIYANMLVENDIYHWESRTYEDAFDRVKRHLRLETDKYDTLITETLHKSLLPSEHSLIWPDGLRSAILWWKTAPSVSQVKSEPPL
jgi:SAM-dependent methyltransferase